MANLQNNFDVRTGSGTYVPNGISQRANTNSHYVYWLGTDGNLWVNQNGNTMNIGRPTGDSWQNGYAEGSNYSMGSQGTLIDDPNPGAVPNAGAVPGAVNALGEYNEVSGSGGSGSAAETSAREAKARQGYTDTITRTNNAIEGLAGSLQNQLDQIEGDYNTYKNEQQSTYSKQKNEYDTSSLQNQQNLLSNRNTIATNSARGLRGLMRTLGAMGAGGGSVALYDAPSMVKAQSDQESNNANKTFAQNQQSLDTNWNNYLNDYENDKKKLEDWRTGQIKSAKQDTEKQRINLLEQLSQAYTDRAAVGGDLDDNYNQITDRINSANQTIRDLGTYTAPQYTGTTATYTAPNLSSYDTGQSSLKTTVTDSGGSGGSPLLTVLRELNKRKQTSPYATGTEA